MKHIEETIAKAKKDIKRLTDEKVYNDDYIHNVKQAKQAEIAALVKEYHQTNIYKLKDMKNNVIRKFDPAAVIADPERPATKYIMPPEEKYKKLLKQSAEMYKLQIEHDQRRNIFSYDINGLPIIEGEVMADEKREVKTKAQVEGETSQKLLENRRMESEIKALRTDDLKAELDKLGETKTGNLDRLNFVASELRVRGDNDTADQLIDRIEAHNIREPWKNDPDYIAAEKEITSQESYIASDDMLFLDENKPIYLKDVFKPNEIDVKEANEKRQQAEIAEYEEAKKRVKSDV